MDVQSVSRSSVTTRPQVSMRRRVLGQGKLGTLFRTFAVFLVTGIFFFPIFFWFLASLKPFGLIFQLPPVIIFTPTFNWYRVVLGFISFNDLMVKLTGALAGTGGGFYFSLPYIVTSLIVGLSSTAVVILVSTPAAYSLSRFAFKHRQDLTFWILSTRMMPPIVAALPLFFMYRQANLIDTYPGVILVHTVINIPLAVLLLKSFFDEVPYDLDEAAMVDGATRWQAFTKVIIHYILPGLAATAILSFIFSWNEMLLTLTLSRTTVRTMPVAASMFDTSTGGTEWGALAAFGTMAMIPVFIFVLFVQRNLVRGLTMGAVKG